MSLYPEGQEPPLLDPPETHVPDAAYKVGRCDGCGDDMEDWGFGPFCANYRCSQSLNSAECAAEVV